MLSFLLLLPNQLSSAYGHIGSDWHSIAFQDLGIFTSFELILASAHSRHYYIQELVLLKNKHCSICQADFPLGRFF